MVALDAVGTNLQHRHEVATVTRFPRDFDIAKVCTFGVQGDPCLAAWRNGDRLWPYATNGIVAGIKHRYRPEENDWAGDPSGARRRTSTARA